MKLIEPSVEILSQEIGLLGVYKQIEKAGKVCYQSTHSISEDSATPFVRRLIESRHYAPLEHGTVYLTIPDYKTSGREEFYALVDFFNKNPYSISYIDEHDGDKYLYITTNYRVLLENQMHGLLEFITEPSEYHSARVTARFICDRAIAQELTRHRKFSFCMESTRFNNYSKDKFNNELIYIMPQWLDIRGQIAVTKETFNEVIKETFSNFLYSKDAEVFIQQLLDAEDSYLKLIEEGWKPEQARNILPLATKCELYMTGFVSDWQDFFNQRCSFLAKTGKPHPQAAELADKLYKLFEEKHLL
mgnify:FL=1